MAVTLRLSRQGQKGRPLYRVVAADKEKPRDGRFLEILGTYNATQDPPRIVLKEDRVRSWIANGAAQSALVRSLIKKTIPGLIEELEARRLKEVQTNRKKRKQRLKGKTDKQRAERKAKRKAKRATKKKAEKK